MSRRLPDEAFGFEEDRLDGAEERPGERLDDAARFNRAAIASTTYKRPGSDPRPLCLWHLQLSLRTKSRRSPFPCNTLKNAEKRGAIANRPTNQLPTSCQPLPTNRHRAGPVTLSQRPPPTADNTRPSRLPRTA